jgi:hypothetical protein
LAGEQQNRFAETATCELVNAGAHQPGYAQPFRILTVFIRELDLPLKRSTEQ